MRVAALAFGVLAGLVASLILALGGLDVAPVAADSADRQAQAIRFGLFVIGNIGVFGAALSLAAPLFGALLLLLGALAWVGAALLLRHSADFVLITPPLLLVLGSIFAFIAHFRRPLADEEEPDVEIITPLRSRAPNPIEDEDEVAMRSFGAEPRGGRAAPLRGMADEDQVRSRGRDDGRRGRGDNRRDREDWNPRRRRPPPPRAKAAFREFDDDDEPSGFARFTLGVSGILSFGLYAALAGAAILIFWNIRGGDVTPPPAAAVETTVTSSAPPPAAPSSSEPVLAPVLTSSAEQPVAPSSTQLSPVRLVDQAGAVARPAGEEDFGDVVMSADPLAPPRLSEDTGLSFGQPEPLSSEPAAQPIDLEPPADEPAAPEAAPEPTSTPTVGPMMPFQMPARMAALRTAPGTGPTQAPPQQQPAQSGDSGL